MKVEGLFPIDPTQKGWEEDEEQQEEWGERKEKEEKRKGKGVENK